MTPITEETFLLFTIAALLMLFLYCIGHYGYGVEEEEGI